MAMISGILGLVGGIISAAGAEQAGNYQAQVAQNNATIAEQNAKSAREAGQQQAANQSQAGAAQEAAIVTGLAASGVDVNTGSAVDVESGQRQVNKLNIDTTLHNAELQAYGYTTQAVNYQAQAGLDKINANNAAAGDILGGIGSFASSASSLPFNWGGGGGGASSAAFAGPSASPDVGYVGPVSGGVIPTSSGFVPGGSI